MKIAERNIQQIHEICSLLNVEQLDLFGSAISGEFKNDSDIDILVRFYRKGGGLFNRYFELKEQLEAIFGREVDLVVEDAIQNPYFKEEIEKRIMTLYASNDQKTSL